MGLPTLFNVVRGKPSTILELEWTFLAPLGVGFETKAVSNY